MLPPSIFRDRALKNQAVLDPPDDIAKVTAPHEWLILIGFAIVFVASCVWIALGSIDRSLTLRGAVIPSGDRYTILSGTTGTIVEIPVNVGDRITREEPLVYLHVPRRNGIPQRATVISPWSGTVTALNFQVGQAVKTGESLADIRIGDDAGYEAIALLPLSVAGALRPGMEALVMIDHSSGQNTIPTQIDSISALPSVQPEWLRRAFASSEGNSRPGIADHLVRLSLPEAPDEPPLNSVPSRIRIILETVPVSNFLVSAPRQAP